MDKLAELKFQAATAEPSGTGVAMTRTSERGKIFKRKPLELFDCIYRPAAWGLNQFDFEASSFAPLGAGGLLTTSGCVVRLAEQSYK